MAYKIVGYLHGKKAWESSHGTFARFGTKPEAEYYKKEMAKLISTDQRKSVKYKIVKV